MLRRDFCLSTLGVSILGAVGGQAKAAGSSSASDFPHVTGLTAEVAKFVAETKYEAIPADVIELGKKSILDGLGLALAGSKAETGVLSRQYVKSLGLCNGHAIIAGTSEKTAPRFASLINGISIHADDFDDTQLSLQKDRVYGLLVHPTVPVLPAIMALSAGKGISGKDMMLAYHVGVEVECKIAEAISPRHYNDGFHTTGTIGPFGATAAAAKVLGLDAGKIRNAMGIAASECGGVRENYGTMTKPLQAGKASEAGVFAAALAAEGWTAAENVLEADRGYFHAAGGGYDPGSIVGKLGNPWTFAIPGVSIKPYPSGALSHPAMTLLQGLLMKNDVKPEQVERVDIGANHNMVNTLLYHQPKAGLEGKFSMEFCLAILVLERKAGLGEYQDSVVQRPDVQDMMKRIHFYVDPDAEAAGFDKMTSIIKINLRDGNVISGRAEFAKGSPSDPMSFDDTAAKFRGSADYADWPKSKAESIISHVKTLESLANVDNLWALLAQ